MMKVLCTGTQHCAHRCACALSPPRHPLLGAVRTLGSLKLRLSTGEEPPNLEVWNEFGSAWTKVCDDLDDASASIACTVFGYHHGYAAPSQTSVTPSTVSWLACSTITVPDAPPRPSCRAMFDTPAWSQCGATRHAAGVVCLKGALRPSRPAHRDHPHSDPRGALVCCLCAASCRHVHDATDCIRRQWAFVFKAPSVCLPRPSGALVLVAASLVLGPWAAAVVHACHGPNQLGC